MQLPSKIPARFAHLAPAPAGSVVLVHFCLALLCILVARGTGNFANLWLANAATIILVLRWTPSAGVRLLAAVTAADLLAHLLGGTGAAKSVGFALANGAEVAIAVLLLRRLQDTLAPRRMLATLLVPVAVTAVPAAVVAAAIAAGTLAVLDDAHAGQVFGTWWRGDVFGALFLMPSLVAFHLEGPRQRASWPGSARQLLAGGLALAMLAWASVMFDFPFIMISAALVFVALFGRLLTSAIVCALALLWLVLLPEGLALAPRIATAALEFSGLGFPQRLLYAALSILPPLVVAAMGADLRRTRRHLSRERTRLQAVTDSVPALIAHLDPTLRYRFVNSKYQEWWGIAPAQMLGRTPADILPAPLAAQLRPLMEQCLQGIPQEFETTIGDGRQLFVQYVPLPAADGANGLVLMATDITERKRLEDALVREKELAQVTLSSIADAVLTVDRAMRVTYLNPVAEQMLGLDAAQALGRPVADVVRLHDPDTAAAAANPAAAAMAGNRVVSAGANTVLVPGDRGQFPIEHSAAPIHDREGGVAGAVLVFRDVTESRAMAQKMSHLAQHDYLTDLPNRVLLEDRIEQALSLDRGHALGALMFLDLDRFKHINDSLGHPAGDRVLQEVARRLRATVRVADTVSRQGGDEFVVLLPQLKDARDAARVAEKLVRSMEAPIDVDGHLLHVRFSLGIALFPADGTDVATLVRNADIALYQAKSSGRGRYCFFNADMSHRAQARLHIENELRAAIGAGGLELHYQPKHDSATGTIVGAEALVRWRRGGRLAMPAEFIEVAEDTGLIRKIDAWTMREACAAAQSWRREGLGDIGIAVNVAFGMHDPRALVDLVREVLRATGLPPRLLTLEIVERQLMLDAARSHGAFAELQALGVRLAVDDFGTDYSNLRYLQRFDFHELKIDRSFVARLEGNAKGQAVVAAIVGVAKALGLEVVAEGVETGTQRDLVVGLGCDGMQGFLFAPGVAEAEFRQLLQAPVASA